ncbi:TAXI family TRAP transporter solute-binding subunit [Thermodesulfobacteriota bacterium]
MTMSNVNFPLVLPDTIRPRLVFEVASEMMGSSRWPYCEPRLELRSQRDEPEVFRFYGACHPDTIREVAERKLDISMVNPEVLLKMAYRGTGPFDRPHPLATIAVIPHYDQLGFAVTQQSGITSLEEIREQRYPLRVSTRGSIDPATGRLINVVLKAYGFSFGHIVSWGGNVSYDQPLPNSPTRIGRVGRDELDAIFDEAISQWGDLVTEAGMRFLPIDEQHLAKLEAEGFKRDTIKRSLYPTLPADVPTVDFSGWPIFCHVDAPDLLITEFCAALEARKDRIQWDIGDLKQPPLPLERMCVDTKEGPLDVPLHRAAERFWRERGYLK